MTEPFGNLNPFSTTQRARWADEKPVYAYFLSSLALGAGSASVVYKERPWLNSCC